MLPFPAVEVAGSTITLATGVFWTVTVAMPDLPRAFAATWVVPSASPLTTPASVTLATAGFWTVQVTDASGTSSPASFCTSACKGSCASIARVGVEGCTTICATCWAASGWVLPHDHVARARTATSARRKFDIAPVLDVSPAHLNRRDARRIPVACDACACHRPADRRYCSPSRTPRRTPSSRRCATRTPERW